MVPDPDDTDDPSTDDAANRPHRGSNPGFDEAALYAVVRKAVEDAILGAIGTLLLVGVSFLIVWVGVTVVVSTQNLPGAALGVLAILVGGYLAAATLEVIPPAREWF